MPQISISVRMNTAMPVPAADIMQLIDLAEKIADLTGVPRHRILIGQREDYLSVTLNTKLPMTEEQARATIEDPEFRQNMQAAKSFARAIAPFAAPTGEQP